MQKDARPLQSGVSHFKFWIALYLTSGALVQLQAAPPADLGQAVATSSRHSNNIIMANSQTRRRVFPLQGGEGRHLRSAMAEVNCASGLEAAEKNLKHARPIWIELLSSPDIAPEPQESRAGCPPYRSIPRNCTRGRFLPSSIYLGQPSPTPFRTRRPPLLMVMAALLLATPFLFTGPALMVPEPQPLNSTPGF